jgi:hypothetical protein
MAPSSPLGPVEAAWLFTRGDESVRLIRVALGGQQCRLLVNGPGSAHYAEEFADAGSCAVQQSEIERRLVAAGYRLNAFRDDRRSSASAPPGESERRRR